VVWETDNAMFSLDFCLTQWSIAAFSCPQHIFYSTQTQVMPIMR
jgi:hypothetical protein